MEELKCYEMLLKSTPNNLLFLTKAAELNYELDRLDNSIKYYKIINALYPTHAKAFYNLAVNLRRMKSWGEAKAVLERYLELVTDDPEGYKDMAEILLEIKEKQQAV
jgi:predicted Zn-dependent protease